MENNCKLSFPCGLWAAPAATRCLVLLLAYFLIPGCITPEKKTALPGTAATQHLVSLQILGVAQDGGYPHVNCRRACCRLYWDGKRPKRGPTCLAITDHRTRQSWMLEATPDYTEQWQRLRSVNEPSEKNAPDGIFLTHAHVGHYTGLMYLGREAQGANAVPVYAMPRMKAYLETNGPWSQLVSLRNIDIRPLQADSAVTLSDAVRITPFRVPHRDEYSETVGYTLDLAGRRILFIPDIDKWEKWDRDIIREIRSVDLAFLDATFYKNGELQRDMREIPHPFIEESMRLFEALTAQEKARVHFIHFNHTNPMLWDDAEVQAVEQRGFRVAREGQVWAW